MLRVALSMPSPTPGPAHWFAGTGEPTRTSDREQRRRSVAGRRPVVAGSYPAPLPLSLSTEVVTWELSRPGPPRS